MTRGTTDAKAASGTTTADVLAWLQRRGSAKVVQGMARYGIPAAGAFGVTVGDLRRYARQIGVNQALSTQLWASGHFEARLLATFIGDATKVTVRQMEGWAKDFDNWAVVDTACFTLFDRAPDRWTMVPRWARAKAEFTRRAAFALIWSLSAHDKAAPDSAFRRCLPLMAKAATDERHYVMKAVSMALRATGKRRPALRAAVVALAERLAKSESPSARTIGRETLRALGRSRARRG